MKRCVAHERVHAPTRREVSNRRRAVCLPVIMNRLAHDCSHSLIRRKLRGLTGLRGQHMLIHMRTTLNVDDGLLKRASA